MSLKETWVDKQNNVDKIMAEDVNSIANGVIECEKDIEKIEKNKLESSELTNAINSALEQAKNSGDFKGDTGAPGATGPKGDTGATGPAGKDGNDYVLTEADKDEIAAIVVEKLGGEPIFGFVDENNNIIVQGNLADGTYNVKYEMEDGSTVDIGDLVLDSNVYYTVLNKLTNCTNSNNAAQAIGGQGYTATITANSGYELKSVSVTMGGSPVTVTNGNISIANVTGNIVITAVAEEIKAKYTNLANPSSSEWGVNKRINSSGGLTATDAGENIHTTNFIGPIKSGDVIRVKGINLTGYNSPVYKPDKTITDYGAAKLSSFNNLGNIATDVTATATGGQLTVGTYAAIQNGYWRFSGILNGTANDVIITINEPIE